MSIRLLQKSRSIIGSHCGNSMMAEKDHRFVYTGDARMRSRDSTMRSRDSTMNISAMLHRIIASHPRIAFRILESRLRILASPV